jgi:hypothetical protein
MQRFSQKILGRLCSKNVCSHLLCHLLCRLLGGEPGPGVGLDRVGVAADGEHDHGVSGHGTRQACPAARRQLLECRRYLAQEGGRVKFAKKSLSLGWPPASGMPAVPSTGRGEGLKLGKVSKISLSRGSPPASGMPAVPSTGSGEGLSWEKVAKISLVSGWPPACGTPEGPVTQTGDA